MAHQTTRARWRFLDGCAQDPDALLQALDRRAPGTDRVRDTGPLPAPLEHLGVKIFRPATGFRRWWPGSGPARREWETARALRAAGLPVAEVVALGPGAAPGGGDALFFRWHPGSTDLARAFEEGRLTPPVCRRLAVSLGRLVRRLHDAGLAHRDLHAGNVLWDGAEELMLVDFHRARRWPWRQRHDVLDLARFFLPWARPADLLRFLRAWRPEDWSRDRARRHRLLRAWHSRAWASLRRFLRHHERRCLGGGRAFRRVRHGAWRGVALRDRWHPAVASLVADPALLSAGSREIHRGRSSIVRRAAHPSGEGDLAVKVYEDPGWTGFWKRLGRGSRARRAWRMGMRLRMARLPTPAPFLFLEGGVLRSGRRSLLVEEFLGSLPPLGSWVARADPLQRRLLASHLGRQVAGLHDAFLRHRDLKAENLLVDPARGACVFLDPDGVRPVRRVGPGLVARDLMRLNASFRPAGPVSLSLRARFLRAYLRARRRERPDRRELWRRVARETEVKWASQAIPPR